MDAGGEDDDDDEPLQRTVKNPTAPTAGQPSTIPLESLESLRPGDGMQRVTVKNTFVHVDDPLRRTESDEPILRTQSAPSGPSRIPVSPRRGSHEVPIEEEEEKEEDEKDEGEGDDDTPLHPTLTLDPFAAFSPMAAAGGPLGVPPADALPGSDGASLWNPFGMAPYLGYGASPWGYGVPAEAFPPLGEGAEFPPLGALHCFHTESHGFGIVSPDLRQFSKGVGYEGRLSVLSEAQVHRGGRHRYLLQFTYGPLGKADGVGFVFASRLPCTKNVQKIVSVFLKQGGQIAMRIFGEIVRASGHVRPVTIGDWIEMDVDLDKSVACFKIWPCDPGGAPIPGKPDSTAEFNFAKKLSKALSKPVDLTVGHFACVIQNVGTTVTIGS